MEKEIQTPYGPVREAALEQLRSTFETSRLLSAVDVVDGFCSQWTEELRRDLLSLHGMAHTVINGAPITEPAADETLTEMAASLSFTLDDAIEPLRGLVRLLDQIADLAPD
jgi:hypothetical protein